MMIRWTAEQISALAPDEQVARAARSLARPGQWQNLGCDAQACWGECQGSGKTPYQVTVALEEPSFKCSCPSRKRPCKHAMGLLLLAQAEPHVLKATAQPEWVHTWLTDQSAQAAKKAQRQTEAVTDPKAQAGRAAQREKRVSQGVETLSLWLEDLLRRGLGSVQGEPPGFWETQAARLVDAQAPGLARRVRAMATIPASGEGWPDRLLRQVASLYLLLEAFSRLEDLPPDVQAEVRAQVGWTQEQDDLRRQPGARDRWLVLSLSTTEEERLRVQRTWLWGVERQQAALLLDFAPLGRPLESSLVPGSSLDAELVFWPGSFPLRALVKERHATHQIEALPGYPDLRAALAAYGAALARAPWLERFLMPVERVIPLRQGAGWAIRDEQDGWLPLTIAPTEGWRLLALSGGQPITLVAEWDGASLAPLSVWTGETLLPLGGAP
jgi:hypothetical protein